MTKNFKKASHKKYQINSDFQNDRKIYRHTIDNFFFFFCACVMCAYIGQMLESRSSLELFSHPECVFVRLMKNSQPLFF